ncbi:hypothetical protein EAH87_05765 [Sphingomonas koreensis]|nr:hypothetical protein EAH87_05765 [Sphingomonas koreensis]
MRGAERPGVRETMVKISEIELLGKDWTGAFSDLSSEPLNEALNPSGDDLIIYVWGSEPSSTRAGSILEMLGNRTVKLTGRYRFRYDPPRSASTGASAAPKGDFHLYQGDVEIAAWDATGKARHGFQAGHRLPKKAYDAIVAQHPGVHGLKGRMLECCIVAVSNHDGSMMINLNETDNGSPTSY